MPTLTQKQKQILDYIRVYGKKHGVSPTFDEIGKHIGKAFSTVHEHVRALIKKGYLIKNDNDPRGLELNEQKKSLIEIPILGTIAAGHPIEEIAVPDGTITLTRDEVGKTGKYFALRVIGNSMVDEGIFDGDTVVIKQQTVADNGQTVVAIIDEGNATLKKFYRERGRIRLQPANPTLFPFYRTEVEVRGIVVKIIRNLATQPEKEAQKNERYNRRIDYSWDFKGEKTKPYTHGMHTYPAMFIPQVARRLLQNYSNKGDTICDIFCGSGTALVESRLLGRNAYGIDLNPLAIFLARTKTTEIDPRILTKEYFSLVQRIEKIKDNQIEKPNFKNINFWFKEEAVVKLAKIKKAINEIKNEKIKNFFMVSFSETVRLSSNTKPGEFKLVRIHKEKLVKYNPDVFGIYKKKTEFNIKQMEEYYKDVDKNAWIKILYGDSSQDNGIKGGSVDYIITSPPYGDSRTTVAYGQFSRLSSQWIDIFENPDKASSVDNELLGGRATKELDHDLKSIYLDQALSKISKIDRDRAKDVLSFNIGLEKCLRQAHKILKPNKYFCLVVGNRLVKQVRIPTDFIIAELAENIGFTCEDIIVRNIPGKRMPIKTSPTNIVGELEETMTKESIVVLRKLK